MLSVGGRTMAVNYIKLWKLLLDKNMKKVEMKELTGISNSTLAKLGKNEYVSMECIERICKALNCDVGDVITFAFSQNEIGGKTYENN